QPGLAARGQLQDHGPPVLGVRGALDEPGVDERGHLPRDRGGVDPHARGARRAPPRAAAIREDRYHRRSSCPSTFQEWAWPEAHFVEGCWLGDRVRGWEAGC